MNMVKIFLKMDALMSFYLLFLCMQMERCMDFHKPVVEILHANARYLCVLALSHLFHLSSYTFHKALKAYVPVH